MMTNREHQTPEETRAKIDKKWNALANILVARARAQTLRDLAVEIEKDHPYYIQRSQLAAMLRNRANEVESLVGAHCVHGIMVLYPCEECDGS